VNVLTNRLRLLGAGVVALLAAATVAGPATASPAAVRGDRTDRAALERAAQAAVLGHAHLTPAHASAAGRGARVTVQTEAGGWASGVAILTAPARGDAYPQGWVFVAEPTAAGWRVVFDTDSGFADAVAASPPGVVSAGERAVYAHRAAAADATGDVSTLAVAASSTGNTTLRLPYAVGQSWTLAGGPHGWGGTDTPYSSVDLSGGDARVLAAGGGTIRVMCTSTQSGQFGGWLRITHPNGYATDYYHLWNVVTPSAGSSISVGAFLGNTGTNTCAGGSATGPHVHFAILIFDNGVYSRVAWNWREVGKWVFWEDPDNPYGGFALHGSARVDVGGALYNYGGLGSSQGIVDAFDSGSVNKRSGPGTSYPIVGSASDGTTLTISCWRNGTTHTGRYGTTSVWDKLTDGTWVSDAFVYTGTNTIGPQC
jgi:LasA protease